MKITELRDGLFNYAKSVFPDWPDYVVREIAYQNLKITGNRGSFDSYLKEIKRHLDGVFWQLENIHITLDVFDPPTQGIIQSRAGGSLNPDGVTNDLRRHIVQQRLIQLNGVSKEPVIAVDTPDGLDLYEGFHRTIQNLRAFPDGYLGPIYIGYR